MGIGCLALMPLFSANPVSAQPPEGSAPPPASAAEQRVSAYLASLRDRPEALREFFRALPKGGDLHHHLAGAAPTELLIKLAGQDGLCVDRATMTAVAPPCGPGTRPAGDARTDAAFRTALTRAWSMEDFPPGRPGHDHFFAAFAKFGEVAWRHRGTLLAEVADELVAQHQSYLETMVTPASDEARKLAQDVGPGSDPARLHRRLLAGGKLDALVADAREEADAADREFRTAARCESKRPAQGCALTVRWISQVSRASTPQHVFTQLALGMRLAERDSRFVAVNLVQPEDWGAALRDYRLHMRMLGYLHRVYPRAHITLHAGELAPGLVKPGELRSHVRQAVLVGHAERIGHGVDLLHEDGWQQLARTMAQRRVAVEVPFTSNRQTLGVAGAGHPFGTYRRYGVPVVLATDNPGIARTDISREYQYAARTYGLDYPELKDLARASLEYAFLPGRSLWAGNPTLGGYRVTGACRLDRPGDGQPEVLCREFLKRNPKAALEWRQESAFAEFEERIAHRAADGS
ncbi:adenosine deaminase [Streptomyces albus subsp. albus]|nr:adenosine deaminase [Streptomyces albus subsp. albus]